MASSPRATILLLAALFHSTTAQFSAQLSSTNVGPFGLAFTSEKAASQTLSCEGLRGRPFVTGLHVQQLSAPLGGRDAYEFRVQCVPAVSQWSDLGPPLLLWASSRQGTAGASGAGRSLTSSSRAAARVVALRPV